MLNQNRSGRHKKFFTFQPLDLRKPAGKITLVRMPAKSSARKKTASASQRDLDTQIEFMEGLVRRDPDYVDALQLLGDHYTQRGRFADGLKVDERLARLEPGNAVVFYNLACSYSLTDQFDRAVARAGTRLRTRLPRFRMAGQRPGSGQTPQAAAISRNPGQNPPAENPRQSALNAAGRRKTAHQSSKT